MSILSIQKKRMNTYAPVPFWSWNNALDKKELLRQIDDMKSVGCGGFVIHARMGLRVPYLSDEWFSLVELCLDAAKERSMSVWIYDENGWPSGFAGGELIKDEENLEKYLTLEKGTAFDETALAVFVEKDGAYTRVKSPVSGATYYTVRMNLCPSYVDILDPAVVGKFITLTHEQYYKRFANRFGKELRGFFTDEPQFMRGKTPYSETVKDYWCKEYGGDLLDNILSLFLDGEEHYAYRVKYYGALNRLYCENYYHRLYDWCEGHGCSLTGHSIQENAFFAQMWGSAGVAPTYEYEHVPAIDQLTRGETARLSARLVGSAAAQTGKKQILTETFACCGYGATPRDLKAVADCQYVHGVNFMCHHLYAYSLSGQGKYDHPPCFSDHIPWHDAFRDFNLYFTRLGYLLAHTEAQVHTTVISPMQSVYLRYDVENEGVAKAEVDDKFTALQDELNAHAVEYEITDERYAEKYGLVQDGKFTVGKRSYDFVIVPDCASLSKSTKTLLEAFVKGGGKVLCKGVPSYTDGVKDDWSFLESTVTIEEIEKGNPLSLQTDGKVEYTYRVGKHYSFLFIVNPTDEEAHVRVPNGFSRIDLVKLAIGQTSSDITLAAGESVVLVPELGKPAISYKSKIELASKLRCTATSDNFMPLDVVTVSYDGVTYGEEEPVPEVFDRLLRTRYRGDLYLKFAFEVQELPSRIKLRREKGKFLSQTLNGRKIEFTQSKFDINFEEGDLKKAVKIGRNEYCVKLDFYEDENVYYALFSPEATESLRNCLVYDTEIEPVTLVGNFTVKDRTLYAQALPADAKNIDKQGYPFFAGKMKFSASFQAKTELARFDLKGSFCAAEVRVNGLSVGSVYENGSIEFFVNSGETNFLEIKISSSLRNLMGPLHLKSRTEDGASPVHFTMRGLWQDGRCELYDPAYNTVPFSIESAQLSFGAYKNK